MKTIPSLFALLSFVATVHAQVVTGNELVRIEVRVASEQDRKDIKNASVDTVTQHKALNITLSGRAKSPETRTGRWVAYGRSAKGGDLAVIESGEFKLDLVNGARQAIESKKITTTYTPEHSTVSRSGNSRTSGKNSNTTRAKKVAASGTKFAGYGVIVKDGDKVVGEYFDPPGLKQEATK